MKARDIMGRPVVAAAKNTTARDVAIQMLMGGFSGMPITERDGVIVGIVTEFDIIHAIRQDKKVETTTAEEIMTTDVASVDVNADVEEVIEILDNRRVLRVPVTERGKLVGVISRPDILRAFIEPNFMTFD
jgi:CBS domain-containing protein